MRDAALDVFERRVMRYRKPGDRKRRRKSDHHGKNERPHAPLGRVESREHDRSALHEHPSGDRVGQRDVRSSFRACAMRSSRSILPLCGLRRNIWITYEPTRILYVFFRQRYRGA